MSRDVNQEERDTAFKIIRSELIRLVPEPALQDIYMRQVDQMQGILSSREYQLVKAELYDNRE